MLFFASVIMPDHLHMLIGSPKKPSDTLRYRKPLEDEPLLMDLDKLKWHSK